jgi:hypothetical protein
MFDAQCYAGLSCAIHVTRNSDSKEHLTTFTASGTSSALTQPIEFELQLTRRFEITARLKVSNNEPSSRTVTQSERDLFVSNNLPHFHLPTSIPSFKLSFNPVHTSWELTFTDQLDGDL